MPDLKTELQRVERVDIAQLTALNRDDIDIQVSTAQRYPRDLAKAIPEIRGLVLSDVETAASCFYAFPRGGKWIVGASIRFAEILAFGWRNLHVGGEFADTGEKYVIGHGVAIDRERNVNHYAKVRRKIMDREGNRFSEDMVAVTGMAAASIAKRNAILAAIPKAIWGPLYDSIEGVITNPAEVDQTRAKALAWFAQKGADVLRVCALVKVESADKIGPKEIFLLRGLSNSIDEGEVSLEQAMRNAKTMPSMPRETKRPPVETPKPKAGTKRGKKKTKPAAPEQPKKSEPQAQFARITEKQRQDLFRLASKRTSTYEDAKKLVRTAIESFGFKTTEAVTEEKYDAIVAALLGDK